MIKPNNHRENYFLNKYLVLEFNFYQIIFIDYELTEGIFLGKDG